MLAAVLPWSLYGCVSGLVGHASTLQLPYDSCSGKRNSSVREESEDKRIPGSHEVRGGWYALGKLEFLDCSSELRGWSVTPGEPRHVLVSPASEQEDNERETHCSCQKQGVLDAWVEILAPY